jgi:hypothetical protein
VVRSEEKANIYFAGNGISKQFCCLMVPLDQLFIS